MSFDFAQRVVVPEDTLVRELDGEAVLLNLDTGHYYSLDEIGAAVWAAVTTAPSVERAVTELLDSYDVDRETLSRDVARILGELRDEGLIRLTTDSP